MLLKAKIVRNNLVTRIFIANSNLFRSYGRPPRTINIEANFVPFNPDILPTEDDWTLLGRPFFHTYWTDCVSLHRFSTMLL